MELYPIQHLMKYHMISHHQFDFKPHPRCSMVLEYLPTFARTKSASFVGKYTSTMGCPKNQPNVGKYTIHGAYGCGFKMFSPTTYGDLAGNHGALGWFG